MKKLNEAEVKDILQHKTDKISDIHTKMLGLYQELNCDFEPDILSAAAMSSPGLSGLPGSPGGMHKDLGDILEKYRRMRQERSLAVRGMMCELINEEDRINRVWACFYSLSNPYFKILKALYVENGLYQAVERESGISHKTFEKHRREGIQQLIRCYESDVGIPKLLHWHDVNKLMQKQMETRGKEEDNYIQFSLTDYLSLPAGNGTNTADKEPTENED